MLIHLYWCQIMLGSNQYSPLESSGSFSTVKGNAFLPPYGNHVGLFFNTMALSTVASQTCFALSWVHCSTIGIHTILLVDPSCLFLHKWAWELKYIYIYIANNLFVEYNYETYAMWIPTQICFYPNSFATE